MVLTSQLRLTIIQSSGLTSGRNAVGKSWDTKVICLVLQKNEGRWFNKYIIFLLFLFIFKMGFNFSFVVIPCTRHAIWSLGSLEWFCHQEETWEKCKAVDQTTLELTMAKVWAELWLMIKTFIAEDEQASESGLIGSESSSVIRRFLLLSTRAHLQSHTGKEFSSSTLG